jgi:signal transduction histidine kinase
MNDGRLLILSNTAAAQSDAVKALTAAGYSVASVATINEAQAQIGSVDLLLIDHDHLDVDGFEAAAQLRDPGSSDATPMLHLARSFAEKTLSSAASDSYLNSSAEMPTLLSMVAALLSARRAERLKDEFLSTVSHELRTPLNSILGWSDILMRQPRDADNTQGLASIERNARQQAQMIADLLDASRMIAGKLEIERGAIDPGFVIDGAIKSVADAAQSRNITIVRDIEASLPPVLADSERLQQIIANLLSNAVKFSLKNGHVTLALHRDGDNARITVSDTGRGIAPELLPTLLNRFRLGAGGKSRGGGLGLGLTIAAHLVALHGGTLTAHSDGDGKGATFTVRLPFAVAG